MAMRKVRAGYTLYHKFAPYKGPCEVDLPDDVAKTYAQMLEPLTTAPHPATPASQAEAVKDVHVKAAEPAPAPDAPAHEGKTSSKKH